MKWKGKKYKSSKLVGVLGVPGVNENSKGWSKYVQGKISKLGRKKSFSILWVNEIL